MENCKRLYADTLAFYRRELSEAELDALETNLDSSYAMIICGAQGEAEDSAYLLCTD